MFFYLTNLFEYFDTISSIRFLTRFGNPHDSFIFLPQLFFNLLQSFELLFFAFDMET